MKLLKCSLMYSSLLLVLKAISQSLSSNLNKDSLEIVKISYLCGIKYHKQFWDALLA